MENIYLYLNEQITLKNDNDYYSIFYRPRSSEFMFDGRFSFTQEEKNLIAVIALNFTNKKLFIKAIEQGAQLKNPSHSLFLEGIAEGSQRYTKDTFYDREKLELFLMAGGRIFSPLEGTSVVPWHNIQSSSNWMTHISPDMLYSIFDRECVDEQYHPIYPNIFHFFNEFYPYVMNHCTAAQLQHIQTIHPLPADSLHSLFFSAGGAYHPERSWNVDLETAKQLRREFMFKVDIILRDEQKAEKEEEWRELKNKITSTFGSEKKPYNELQGLSMIYESIDALPHRWSCALPDETHDWNPGQLYRNAHVFLKLQAIKNFLADPSWNVLTLNENEKEWNNKQHLQSILSTIVPEKENIRQQEYWRLLMMDKEGLLSSCFKRQLIEPSVGFSLLNWMSEMQAKPFKKMGVAKDEEEKQQLQKTLMTGVLNFKEASVTETYHLVEANLSHRPDILDSIHEKHLNAKLIRSDSHKKPLPSNQRF